MSDDPIERLSSQQLWVLAQDVVIQLEKGSGTRPVLWMLSQAKARAAQAIVGLLDADPNNPKVIIGFQNEVRLYEDMIKSARALLQRGKEADYALDEEERADISEIVGVFENEGFHQPQGYDS